MKGRPKSIRKIAFMPTVSGFRPYGGQASASESEGVFLFYEEYEALRLNDYEKHTHCESAAIMGVSRPTFTRIYAGAREKIAKAFIEGRTIIIEGGKVELDGNWYVCHNCKAQFSTEGQDTGHCALCGSTDIARYSLMEETQHGTDTPLLSDSPLPLRAEEMSFSPSDNTSPRGCGRRKCARKRDNK